MGRLKPLGAHQQQKKRSNDVLHKPDNLTCCLQRTKERDAGLDRQYRLRRDEVQASRGLRYAQTSARLRTSLRAAGNFATVIARQNTDGRFHLCNWRQHVTRSCDRFVGSPDLTAHRHSHRWTPRWGGAWSVFVAGPLPTAANGYPCG